jgi:hypothetical protein
MVFNKGSLILGQQLLFHNGLWFAAIKWKKLKEWGHQ